MKGAVVSDLHLYSRRSDIKRYFQDIKSAASEVDYFVLNGDIIDLPWATQDSPAATFVAAQKWLESLIKAHPKCKFIYVLGNHDCCVGLLEVLDILSLNYSNFEYRYDYFKLGNKLFFHGDLLLKPRPHLRRVKLFDDYKIRKGVSLAFYKALIDSGIHTAASKLFTANNCSRWIHKTLKNEPVAQDTDHVYFGHTHNYFEDHEYEGLVFHNTGSTLKNSHLQILKVRD